MQTTAGRAQLLREPGLERGLAILELEGDLPLAARMRRTDFAQRVAYCSAIRGGQNPAGVQRLGVRAPRKIFVVNLKLSFAATRFTQLFAWVGGGMR